MSGNFLLDWAALAFSLFNMIVLAWLGLTVLLNAEKRTVGVWLAGDGLLIGAAFFITHSVLLGEGVMMEPQGLNFWWHAGWWPVVASPFAWYLLMLWFTGFWDAPQSALFHRHLPWLVANVFFTLLLVGLILFANPLPVFSLDAVIDLTQIPSLGGVPLLVIGYPLYIVICISLALDCLLHPAPSSRLMGDQARQHSRPWLLATTLILLSVSLLVGWVMAWAVSSAGDNRPFIELYARLSYPLAWYDLALEALIAAATLTLGQAIVSYEIFTGKTLPRRGFQNQWRNAILLAAGISLVTTFSLDSRLHPIYTILLVLLAMTAFFALFSWRSHVEREQSMRQLRPFVTSQRLYERFLTPRPAPAETDLSIPFAALCRDVLATRQATLAPLGPFAVLAGAALTFPTGSPASLPDLSSLVGQLNSPHQILSLDATAWAGYTLAVSLWSERGLIGLLLVGEKVGGGFYSAEEIEIARASGERLLDILASAEMAHRLVDLQRQRMVESQVLDRQTRRVLHDDVLPRLHAALLTLNGLDGAATPTGQEISGLLVDVHRQIADLLHAIPPASSQEVGRMGLFGALRQVAGGELDQAFDQVAWQVEPDVEANLPALSPLGVELAFYAAREVMRNAARHARPSTPGAGLQLTVSAAWQSGLALTIEDNGMGMALPRDGGASPAAPPSGQGLGLHSAMLAVVGGTLALESVPGRYTRVRISVPANNISSA